MNALKTVIFMADDDEDDRYFMRMSLQAIDPSMTIVEAEDGDELLTLLHAWSQASVPLPVHLILLDMNMPKVNGLEALKAIKANPLLRHIPAVMISTSADPKHVTTAYQNGVSGYIQKSISGLQQDEVARAIKVCYLNAATN